MGAVLEGVGSAVFGGGGGDDVQTGGASELDGGGSDATGGAVNEDGFATDATAALEEGAEGGAARGAEGSALLEGGALGEGVNVVGIAEDEFGVGAGEGFVGVDAVAGFEAGDAFADALNEPGGVVAGGEGEFAGAVFAGAGIGFDGVDSDGAGADEHLAFADGGRGNVLELEDVGLAKFVDSDRLHIGFR